MTLIELSQALGKGARIKIVWTSEDGWVIAVSTRDGRTWATRMRGGDLEETFTRCLKALEEKRVKELS
jgi:hypothetical protein